MTVYCVRRFKPGPTELVRVITLPLPPVAGMQLEFPEGGGTSSIALVEARIRKWAPGAYAPDVTVSCHSEPLDRLELAKRVGWRPVHQDV